MPTRREYSGNAPATTLSAAVTNASNAFSVADATGYPTGAVGPFFLVIDMGTALEEKVLVTSRTGNTMNGVARGQDGTSGLAHAVGAPVQHVWTAVDAAEANRHGADTTQDDHTQYHTATRHGAVAHTTAMIGDAQVTTTKIADANVTAAKLAASVPLGYLNHTASSGTAGTALGLTTTESSTNVAITFTALAGRRYKITGFITFFTSGDELYLTLRRGTTTTAPVVQFFNGGAKHASGRQTAPLVAIDTPPAGSVTYTLFGRVNVNNADIYAPFALVVEDIGGV